MNEYLLEIRQYMEKYFPTNYQHFKRSLDRFQSNIFKEKLEFFYLKQVKEKYHFDRDEVRVFTNELCKYMNEVNVVDLEYYLEYYLEFYENLFLELFYFLYRILVKCNYELKNICHNYLRYCGKNDMPDLFHKLFSCLSPFQKDDLQEIMTHIVEIEKQHILNCYELARSDMTYCQNCISFCYELDETGHYKRNVPFRY